MSKKNKKIKDFWGTTAEDQLEEQELFDEMEEKGEVDIFSLGKVKKHYTGIEPEITADINKVFGNKPQEGNEYKIPSDSFETKNKESEMYVASLKSESYDDGVDDIHFDPSMAGPTAKENKTRREDKPVENKDNRTVKIENAKKDNKEYKKNDSVSKTSFVRPITFRFNNSVLELRDSTVSLYYKVVKGEDAIRFINPNVTYDDSVLREILYLIREIVAFRYPSALYKFDEFETLFDEVKGTFIDAEHEARYMFVDFDDYVAAYYFGEDGFIEQLKKLRVAKTNTELADIIVGLATASLDFDVSFRRADFESFYESENNKRHKKTLIDLINADIEPSDRILMLDVHSFKTLFAKSEVILDKYVSDDTGVNADIYESDDELEDEINKLLSDDSDDEIDDEDDDDEFELPDDDDEEGDDESDEEDGIEYDSEISDDIPEDLEESTDEEPEDDNSLSDTASDDSNDNQDSDGVEESIDSMIDEAVADEEPEAKPIDKVAVNNPNKDQSMVVEVTRKQHP